MTKAISRPDIAVAVLKDGTMLLAQGTGVERMIRHFEDRISEAETDLYWSQVAHRSICRKNDEWRICVASEGIGVTFNPSPKKLHGGDILILEPKPQTI
jgi:hypothetical protein